MVCFDWLENLRAADICLNEYWCNTVCNHGRIVNKAAYRTISAYTVS